MSTTNDNKSNLDINIIKKWLSSAEYDDVYTFDLQQVNSLFHSLIGVAVATGALETLLLRMAVKNSDKEFREDVQEFVKKMDEAQSEIFSFVNYSAEKWTNNKETEKKSNE